MLNNQSLAYQYFELKLQKTANPLQLKNAYEAACQECLKKYPQAKAGSNYWSRIDNFESLPLDEQYFIRKLSFHGYLAGEDPELTVIEAKINSSIQNQNQSSVESRMVM